MTASRGRLEAPGLKLHAADGRRQCQGAQPRLEQQQKRRFDTPGMPHVQRQQRGGLRLVQQAQLQMQRAQIPCPQEVAESLKQLFDGRQQPLRAFHRVLEFDTAVEARRALVRLHRRGHAPQTLVKLAQELGAEALAQRVTGKPPDIPQGAQPAVVQLPPAADGHRQTLHGQPAQRGAQILLAMNQQIAAGPGQQQAGRGGGTGGVVNADRKSPLTQQRFQQLLQQHAQPGDAAEIAQRAAGLEDQAVRRLHAHGGAQCAKTIGKQNQSVLARLFVGNAQQLGDGDGVPQGRLTGVEPGFRRLGLCCPPLCQAQRALRFAQQWQLMETPRHGCPLLTATVSCR
jgi:hypothetical protein